MGSIDLNGIKNSLCVNSGHNLPSFQPNRSSSFRVKGYQTYKYAHAYTNIHFYAYLKPLSYSTSPVLAGWWWNCKQKILPFCSQLQRTPIKLTFGVERRELLMMMIMQVYYLILYSVNEKVNTVASIIQRCPIYLDNGTKLPTHSNKPHVGKHKRPWEQRSDPFLSLSHARLVSKSGISGPSKR